MLPVAVNDGLQVSVQPLMSAKSQKPPLADAGTRGPRDSRTPGQTGQAVQSDPSGTVTGGPLGTKVWYGRQSWLLRLY
jgi:hypothetical protein